MELTAHRPADDRERVDGRLRHNLIAWLSTVRPDGQPACLATYLERIETNFGGSERFADLFSAALIILSTRLYA
jgi:hypothetical protein